MTNTPFCRQQRRWRRRRIRQTEQEEPRVDVLGEKIHVDIIRRREPNFWQIHFPLQEGVGRFLAEYSRTVRRTTKGGGNFEEEGREGGEKTMEAIEKPEVKVSVEEEEEDDDEVRRVLGGGDDGEGEGGGFLPAPRTPQRQRRKSPVTVQVRNTVYEKCSNHQLCLDRVLHSAILRNGWPPSRLRTSSSVAVSWRGTRTALRRRPRRRRRRRTSPGTAALAPVRRRRGPAKG